MLDLIKGGLFGVAVGDALGVPVEFLGRGVLEENPVAEMREYGTHNQPKGTWSDDSSLTFCLADSLTKRFDLNDIANSFVKWCYEDYWTPHGHVFDIGIGTRKAIDRVMNKAFPPEICGGMEEQDNGNGSLMRILPLAYYLYNKEINERFTVIQQVSSITHAHIRSVLGCFIYIELALELMKGKDKWEAYKNMKTTVLKYCEEQSINPQEIQHYEKVLTYDITSYSDDVLRGSGYVVQSLEASLWCFLKGSTYEEVVLSAVNLGEDTDTTGAIAGGLAGLYYGFDTIPSEWIEVLARKEDIMDLCERLNEALNQGRY